MDMILEVAPFIPALLLMAAGCYWASQSKPALQNKH